MAMFLAPSIWHKFSIICCGPTNMGSKTWHTDGFSFNILSIIKKKLQYQTSTTVFFSLKLLIGLSILITDFSFQYFTLHIYWSPFSPFPYYIWHISIDKKTQIIAVDQQAEIRWQQKQLPEYRTDNKTTHHTGTVLFDNLRNHCRLLYLNSISLKLEVVCKWKHGRSDFIKSYFWIN